MIKCYIVETVCINKLYIFYLVMTNVFKYNFRGSNRCPKTCDAVLSLQKINRDEFCNREIMELKCFCRGKNQRCEWQGCLKDLEVSVCMTLKNTRAVMRHL